MAVDANGARRLHPPMTPERMKQALAEVPAARGLLHLDGSGHPALAAAAASSGRPPILG